MKTDSQLQQDVIAELKWEPAINDTQITVSVNKSVVTLNGHVDSFSQKWDAERAAQRVSGVKALAVEIDVALPNSSQRNDVDIARSAENILKWTSYIPREHIKVMVENGFVTLTGEVNWDYQKRTALNTIYSLFGVTGVNNQISIKPRPSASNIKLGIESAISRQAKSDRESITVSVNGSEVTLNDKAHSYYERNLISNAAWSAQGVQKVINHVIVAY